jgi:hypothetical protein
MEDKYFCMVAYALSNSFTLLSSGGFAYAHFLAQETRLGSFYFLEWQHFSGRPRAE